MTGSRSYSQLAYQLLLLLILLGLVLATALPARGTEAGESWSLRDVVRRLEPAVVWILADLGGNQWSQGSGFIVHEDGYIVTNAHVIAGANEIMVGWPDRFDRSMKSGEIVAADTDLDIALIHVDAVHLPALPVDSSRSAGLGDAVITLGYPAGEELGLGGLTVTRGVLSCLRLHADGEVNLLQTDAAVTLGCSGGPLYDLDTGSVIGVIQGKGMLLLEGFNFAIPISKLFDLSMTNPEDGVEAVIASLAGPVGPDYSRPSQRALDLYGSGLEARSRDEWGEALSNFRAAWQLEGEDPRAAYGMAESYAALDQPRQALRWLERAFELGYSDFEGALESEGFSGFRDDDRFVELVQSF